MIRYVIKIFIASPGDLTQERRVAKNITEEENKNHAHHAGYHFELVGWEDTVAQDGRAQEIINRDLDQCEYFFGMLWKRWGTPPGPSGGLYTSGFEEEYERSRKRHEATGLPKISLFFKNLSTADQNDPGPQLVKVFNFRDNYSKNFRGLYQIFEDIGDFESKFRSLLAFILKEKSESQTKDGGTQILDPFKLVNSKGYEDLKQKQTISRNLSHFDPSLIDFLTEFISKPTSENGNEYTALEVARFRLIATTVGLFGNDKVTIGPHDSNLIYRGIQKIVLTRKELKGLAVAGLSHFETENAPLWLWLRNLEEKVTDFLVTCTLTAADSQIRSAFRIMELLEIDLCISYDNVTRKDLLMLWIDNPNKNVAISALSYLTQNGINSDLEVIEKLLGSDSSMITSAAFAAKIGITLKENPSSVLEVISSANIALTDKNLVTEILSKIKYFSTNLLKKSLAIQDMFLQKGIVAELFSRGELLREDGEFLVMSRDASIRLIGAKVLRAFSDKYTISDAKKHIVRPDLVSELGVFDKRKLTNDFEGEEIFENYQHDEFRRLTKSELRVKMKTEKLFDFDATFAFYDEYYNEMKPEIKRNMMDRFKEVIEKRLSSALVTDEIEAKLFEFLQRKLLQKALNLIVRKTDRSLIDIVRTCIDNSDVVWSYDLIYYFERVGDYKDVERIVRVSMSANYNAASLLLMINTKVDLPASIKVILKLSKNRLIDLLNSSMPTVVLTHVFAHINNDFFNQLSDDQILSWLINNDDKIRRVVAIKCVISMSKTRILNIIEKYQNTEQKYFYNVVFILDLISLGKRKARTVALKYIKAI